MSSLERGYGEWKMTIKFPVETEVDVKDEDFFFPRVYDSASRG